ncbi:hypothetical protein GCM10011452_09540 [Gemmobacter lanyuensis]|uniref:Uncharacterized protein n=1 Tax=Gemmobacter lanyuensis TaxID=1054497 RepID=A0A918INF6_9RHOB|nr:hypothetical protein [Gemmobacter lanyuensis]GGW24164.1 hypothetical protein GCM10011452_09540 [Gemmobacter lanyuensis]
MSQQTRPSNVTLPELAGITSTAGNKWGVRLPIPCGSEPPQSAAPVQPAKPDRAPRTDYAFDSRRPGDVVEVTSDQERHYLRSAFANWRRKLGDACPLDAVSLRDDTGRIYAIQFIARTQENKQ